MRTSVQELEAERHHIQQLIQASKKRLKQRELQLAQYGINADPQIPIEIEEIRQRINALEQRDLQIEQTLIHMHKPIMQIRRLLIDRLTAKYVVIGIMAAFSILFFVILASNAVNSIRNSLEKTQDQGVNNDKITEPVEFVAAYYDLINKRRYDEAFLMLSDSFKQINHCCNEDGTFNNDDYVSYWNTIDSVRIIQASTEYADQSRAVLNIILLYTRVDSTQVEQNLRLYLARKIDDSDNNNTWLINQAETIYNR